MVGRNPTPYFFQDRGPPWCEPFIPIGMGKIIWLDYGMLLLVNPRAFCSSSGTEGSWNSFLQKSNVLRAGGWNNGCDMIARELGRGECYLEDGSC